MAGTHTKMHIMKTVIFIIWLASLTALLCQFFAPHSSKKGQNITLFVSVLYFTVTIPWAVSILRLNYGWGILIALASYLCVYGIARLIAGK